MSGGPFSADWLALREPADHASRDLGLVAALADALKPAERPVRIVDLGCGTGSNLRALASALPAEQRWRLLDDDPALLDRARASLVAWAEEAAADGHGLSLRRAGRRMAVTFHRHDLSADLDDVLGEAPDLVTASALFDLFSCGAIDRLAAAVAARRASFFTALTYDGREEWRPAHDADPAVQAAFLSHLARDKGFGPAAGHRATEVLAGAFRRRGYAVRTADSTWHLGPRERNLRVALADGKAAAVAETGLVAAHRLESWRSLRAGEGSVEIGHTDLLALP